MRYVSATRWLRVRRSTTYRLFTEDAINLFVRLKGDEYRLGRGDAATVRAVVMSAITSGGDVYDCLKTHEHARQSFKVISAFLSFFPRSPSAPFS